MPPRRESRLVLEPLADPGAACTGDANIATDTAPAREIRRT